MQMIGPVMGLRPECERVLRTLPKWFGIEAALVEYAESTNRLPTFVARNQGVTVGFMCLKEHFAGSWEVHCMAIEAEHRNAGVGRRLHDFAESWIARKGAHCLQVKTLAETHPSPEYEQTRTFYQSLGYRAVEVFPTLWGEGLPVLQLAKVPKSAA